MAGVVGQGKEFLSDREADTTLAKNLARQRAVALGKRFVNTQGPAAIALADEKFAKQEADDAEGWMA